MKSGIPQHKAMAMGKKPAFARGGAVPIPAGHHKLPASPKLLKSPPNGPMEKVKRANGIKGL